VAVQVGVTWVLLQAVTGTVQAAQLAIIVSIAAAQLVTIAVVVYTLMQLHVVDIV
jgi:hypothetical protein